VALSQRLRLTRAVVAVMAERGYAATTVSDIIRVAGVSRTTFYAQFPDKDTCALAAYELAVDIHQEQLRQAAARADGTAAQLRAVVEAEVAALTEVPDYAQLLLLHVVSLGPRAWEAHQRALEATAGLLREIQGQQGEPALPASVYVATVAGLHQLLRQQLLPGSNGGHDQLVQDAQVLLGAVLGIPELLGDG
jgi:AcrR family transcriptional regulator